MSQDCPQRIQDSNSESFRPRKSSTSSPLPVNCQKIISDGKVNKIRFDVSASEIISLDVFNMVFRNNSSKGIFGEKPFIPKSDQCQIFPAASPEI